MYYSIFFLMPLGNAILFVQNFVDSCGYLIEL